MLVYVLFCWGFILHLLFGEVPKDWRELREALFKLESSPLHDLVASHSTCCHALTSGVLLGWLGMLMQTWFVITCW